MTDEELKELGLPAGAINQLRSIVTKINNTNGLCNVDKRDSGPSTGRRKLDSKAEADQVKNNCNYAFSIPKQNVYVKRQHHFTW
jgi:hypothetical protein